MTFKITQTYPLPKKPIQYNQLVRIKNFDTRIEGTEFLQTHIEAIFNPRKVYKIWAYRQDVKEDRINIFKASQALKIKKKHEVTFTVRLGFYIEAGIGTWSDSLSYAIILPDEPDRLPPFIKQNQFLFNGFSEAIKQRKIDTVIVENLEEENNRLGEHLVRADTDRLWDKFTGTVNKIVESLHLKEKKEGGEKSKDQA